MKSLMSLIFWGTVFLIVWVVTWPFKGNKTNCFVWAVSNWQTQGGYLVVRWCQENRWVKYPHFLWLPNQQSNLYHVYPKEGEPEHAWWFNPKEIERDEDLF